MKTALVVIWSLSLPFDIPISLIRQHLFCPRIPYFVLMNFQSSPAPSWVKQGQKIHHKSDLLFNRRNLNKFQLESASKSFHTRVYSQELHLFGILDMILENDSEIFPVEFKTRGPRPIKAHILQVTAYGICAEETLNKNFNTAFLAYRDENKIFKVEKTEENINKIRKICSTIRKNIEKSILPDSDAQENKCAQCEWYRYCNDRF